MIIAIIILLCLLFLLLCVNNLNKCPCLLEEKFNSPRNFKFKENVLNVLVSKLKKCSNKHDIVCCVI